MLLRQLPAGSRVLSAADPDLAWSVEALLLRQIDYDLRCLIHALAGGKGEAPVPVPTPSEARALDAALEGACEAASEVYGSLAHIFPEGMERR